jgi:deoxycytidine triphosphate deaminase
LEGKKGHHHKGIFMQGGVLNPGWKGRLTIELTFTNEVKITKGDKIAHAIIFTFDDKVETTRDTKGTNKTLID